MVKITIGFCSEPSYLDLHCLTFSLLTFHLNFFPIDSFKKKQITNVVWSLALKELSSVDVFSMQSDQVSLGSHIPYRRSSFSWHDPNDFFFLTLMFNCVIMLLVQSHLFKGNGYIFKGNNPGMKLFTLFYSLGEKFWNGTIHGPSHFWKDLNTKDRRRADDELRDILD